MPERETEQRLQSFIGRHRLAVTEDHYQKDVADFRDEMRRGLAGEASSLPMIPAYISSGGRVSGEKRVVAVDAGGTNLRIAEVAVAENRPPRILRMQRCAMPGTGEELTAGAFFDKMAEYLAPYMEICDAAGVCFSFAAAITPERDAVITEFSKEVKIGGAGGRRLAGGIRASLQKLGVKPPPFTVVNDTTAVLLAARASGGEERGGYLGFILGTGTNICYEERMSHIRKLPDFWNRDGRVIVNVESGMYGGYARGDIDDEIDQKSENPGSHRLEKMMSGAYLGEVIRTVLRRAAGEGVFSAAASERLLRLQSVGLYDADRFYGGWEDNPLAACFEGSENDFAAGARLIDAVMRRAAYLMTVVIGAVLLQADIGKEATLPAVICAEGTTFYKTAWLRDHFFPLAKRLTGETLRRHFEWVGVEDAAIIGAALAGAL